jgi:hypothetical protein
MPLHSSFGFGTFVCDARRRRRVGNASPLDRFAVGGVIPSSPRPGRCSRTAERFVGMCGRTLHGADGAARLEGAGDEGGGGRPRQVAGVARPQAPMKQLRRSRCGGRDDIVAHRVGSTRFEMGGLRRLCKSLHNPYRFAQVRTAVGYSLRFRRQARPTKLKRIGLHGWIARAASPRAAVLAHELH